MSTTGTSSLSDLSPTSPQPFGTAGGVDLLSPVSFEVDSSELNDLVSSFFATGETLDPEKEEQKKSSKKSAEPLQEDSKQIPESFIFGNFQLGDLDDLPNFQVSQKKSGRVLLSKLLQKKIGPISFSAPAARNKLVLFGTDTKTTTEHYLLCLDGKRIEEEHKAVTGFQIRTEPIQFSLWLSDSTFACALGTGKVETFRLNSSKSIESTGSLSLHTDEIREVTVDPRNAHLIATAGYDCKLLITDLNRKTVQSTKLSAVGSSVKWSAFSNSALGCTTDDGMFLLYDIRSGKFEYTYSAKKDLFTHLRYTPFNILLGMGDGELRHLDLRKPAPLSLVEDPFCEGIGIIDFNQKDAIVVSGFSDFTVWKQDSKTLDLNIWSHSAQSKITNQDSTLSYCATFLDEDVVVATDSAGFYGNWTQGFNIYE